MFPLSIFSIFNYSQIFYYFFYISISCKLNILKGKVKKPNPLTSYVSLFLPLSLFLFIHLSLALAIFSILTNLQYFIFFSLPFLQIQHIKSRKPTTSQMSLFLSLAQLPVWRGSIYLSSLLDVASQNYVFQSGKWGRDSARVALFLLFSQNNYGW